MNQPVHTMSSTRSASTRWNRVIHRKGGPPNKTQLFLHTYKTEKKEQEKSSESREKYEHVEQRRQPACRKKKKRLFTTPGDAYCIRSGTLQGNIHIFSPRGFRSRVHSTSLLRGCEVHGALLRPEKMREPRRVSFGVCDPFRFTFGSTPKSPKISLPTVPYLARLSSRR